MCDRNTTSTSLSEEAFERRLADLLRTAKRNDIDIQGWYPVYGLEDGSHWDVEITELASDPQGDSQE